MSEHILKKTKCRTCARFDRPRREGEDGWCTQLGETTSEDAGACFWYTRRRGKDETEKD